MRALARNRSGVADRRPRLARSRRRLSLPPASHCMPACLLPAMCCRGRSQPATVRWVPTKGMAQSHHWSSWPHWQLVLHWMLLWSDLCPRLGSSSSSSSNSSIAVRWAGAEQVCSSPRAFLLPNFVTSAEIDALLGGIHDLCWEVQSATHATCRLVDWPQVRYRTMFTSKRLLRSAVVDSWICLRSFRAWKFHSC